jgi:hypothetical protein
LCVFSKGLRHRFKNRILTIEELSLSCVETLEINMNVASRPCRLNLFPKYELGACYLSSTCLYMCLAISTNFLRSSKAHSKPKSQIVSAVIRYSEQATAEMDLDFGWSYPLV